MRSAKPVLLKSFPEAPQSEEVWRTVPSNPLYEVSDQGRVRRSVPGPGAQAGRVLKPRRDKNGYLEVALYDGRGHGHHGRHGRRINIHRLVLEAFDRPRLPYEQCRHLDGDKQNNRLSNLRWGLPTENAADTRRHGRFAIGEKNGQAKLTERDVRLIRRGAQIGLTQRRMASLFGVTHSAIANIALGKRWRHVA